MRPKQTTIAKVALPGFCAVVIAPDVETAEAEAVVAPEVGEAVPVVVEVITIEDELMCMVTVVVPVLVEGMLTDFFSERT